MKRLLIALCFAAFLLTAVFAVADDQQDLMAANKALMQAAANSDGNAAEVWLDAAFTATDSFGRTESRAEALQDSQTFTDVPSGNPQMRIYGNVGVIITEREKRHVMMVWVKRAEGWRTLIYHEVRQADAPAAPGAGSKDCTNPCKTVPYKPKSADEQDLIASWQQAETAVTNHDSKEFARHLADEFVLISSAGDKPLHKAERLAIVDQQKQAKTPSAPPALVNAELFVFPGAAVMASNHKGADGKSTHGTRVWVKREGVWQVAFSFQTTVQ
jgi:hypothetical protein